MKLGIPLLIGGTSVTGIVAIGSYYALTFKGSTIKEELKDKKFILASDGAQGTEEFKSDSENIKASIPELKNATDSDGGSRLKAGCESQMGLDAKKNFKSLELVGKYCLIRDMASQLARNGKTLLTKGSLEGDWTATYTKRKNKSSTRADVGLNDSAGTDSTDLPIIQKGCEDNSKKEFLVSNKDSIYPKLVSGCTKEAASEQ